VDVDSPGIKVFYWFIGVGRFAIHGKGLFFLLEFADVDRYERRYFLPAIYGFLPAWL